MCPPSCRSARSERSEGASQARGGRAAPGPAILPSFCPTDLYRAARPRITLHDRSICTPADQGECNSGEPCRTDLNAPHPAENRKVGGSIPSLPTTNGVPLAGTVNERSTTDPRPGSGAVTIRKRRDGWQVIVYAGLDPLTGKQRQLTRRSMAAAARPRRSKPACAPRSPTGSTPAPGLRPSASWLTCGSNGAPPATSPSPPTRSRTTAA
jgi:hypothetical protein